MKYIFLYDSNGSAKIRKNISLSATDSIIDIENSKLSSPSQQKLEVGSPISSSLSSHSRIKVSKILKHLSMFNEISWNIIQSFFSILHLHSTMGMMMKMTMKSNQMAQQKLNVNEKEERKRKRRKTKRKKRENATNLFQVSKIFLITTQC